MICLEVTCKLWYLFQPHDFIASLVIILLPEYGLGLISKSTCYIMMTRIGASSMCLDLKDAYYSQSPYDSELTMQTIRWRIMSGIVCSICLCQLSVNLQSESESEIWMRNLKSESWIWNLNLKSESEIWIWNQKSESESGIWTWNLNLKPESIYIHIHIHTS